MHIERCKLCKHFDSFFVACNLYTKETYLDGGDYEEYFVPIREIIDEDCEYEYI